MLAALQKLGRLDARRDEADLPAPDEAAVYKNLLLDLQFNQLQVSREYQALFEEKEREIARLKALVGEPVVAAKPEPSPVKPLRDISQDELRIVLREWERKMKANILAKTEAIAEAQSQREIVDALKSQLSALREHVRTQDEAIKRQGTLQSAMDQSRSDHAAAMERMVAEFAKVTAETEALRAQLAQANLEVAALRTKAESDKKTLEILVASAPSRDHAPLSPHVVKEEPKHAEHDGDVRLQVLLREAESRVEELDSRVTQLESELATTASLLSTARADADALRTDNDSLRTDAEQLRNDAASLRNELALAKSAVATAQMLADTLRSEATQAQVSLDSTVRVEADQLRTELAQSKVDLDAVRAHADHLRTEAARSHNEHATAVAGFTATVDALRVELARCKTEVDSAQATSQTLSKEVAELQKQLEAAKAHVASLSTELAEAQSESAAAAQVDAEVLKEEIASMRDQLSKAHASLEETQRAFEAAQTEAAYIKLQHDAQHKEAETRIGDLSAQLKERQTELARAREALDTEVARGMDVDSRLIAAQAEIKTLRGELDNLKESLKSSERELAAVRASEQATEASRQALDQDLLVTRASLQAVEARLEKLEQEQKVKEEQAAAKATKEAEARHEAAMRQARAAMEAIVKAKESEAAHFKEMFAKETALRRAVHDELMDIKGNIRVFARVRPVLAGETKLTGHAAREVAEFPPESGGRDLVVRKEDDSRSRFEFDAVFDQSSTQAQVFSTIAPLVVSFLDGVNVTLFAYGQTGSGKTYTMEGTPEDPGVNGRALARVFELVQERAATTQYTLQASVLEVYNEGIYDLLVANSEALDIRMNPDSKSVFVQGLSQRTVSRMEDIADLMRVAHSNRSTGKTNMNEHSSRSHLVFTLTATSKPIISASSAPAVSNLTLIDLAGSERLDKSHAQGDRLKEAQAINKSLSALGDVIQALGERGKAGGHIPFRNSKLTYLLQDQLSGNAKVGFFVNVSSVEWNVQETMCSLKFAERCRKTELGSKQLQGGAQHAEIAKLKRVIEDLQMQVDPLRATTTSPAPKSTTTSPVKPATSTPNKPATGVL